MSISKKEQEFLSDYLVKAKLNLQLKKAGINTTNILANVIPDIIINYAAGSPLPSFTSDEISRIINLINDMESKLMASSGIDADVLQKMTANNRNLKQIFTKLIKGETESKDISVITPILEVNQLGQNMAIVDKLILENNKLKAAFEEKILNEKKLERVIEELKQDQKRSGVLFGNLLKNISEKEKNAEENKKLIKEYKEKLERKEAKVNELSNKLSLSDYKLEEMQKQLKEAKEIKDKTPDYEELKKQNKKLEKENKKLKYKLDIAAPFLREAAAKYDREKKNPSRPPGNKLQVLKFEPGKEPKEIQWNKKVINEFTGECFKYVCDCFVCRPKRDRRRWQQTWRRKRKYSNEANDNDQCDNEKEDNSGDDSDNSDENSEDDEGNEENENNYDENNYDENNGNGDDKENKKDCKDKGQYTAKE